MPTISFDEILRERLRNPEFAAAFLNDALDSGNTEEIAQAMEYVVDVHGDTSTWDTLALYMPRVLTQLEKYGLSLVFRPSLVTVNSH